MDELENDIAALESICSKLDTKISVHTQLTNTGTMSRNFAFECERVTGTKYAMEAYYKNDSNSKRLSAALEMSTEAITVAIVAALAALVAFFYKIIGHSSSGASSGASSGGGASGGGVDTSLPSKASGPTVTVSNVRETVEAYEKIVGIIDLPPFRWDDVRKHQDKILTHLKNQRLSRYFISLVLDEDGTRKEFATRMKSACSISVHEYASKILKHIQSIEHGKYNFDDFIKDAEKVEKVLEDENTVIRAFIDKIGSGEVNESNIAKFYTNAQRAIVEPDILNRTVVHYKEYEVKLLETINKMKDELKRLEDKFKQKADFDDGDRMSLNVLIKSSKDIGIFYTCVSSMLNIQYDVIRNTSILCVSLGKSYRSLAALDSERKEEFIKGAESLFEARAKLKM